MNPPDIERIEDDTTRCRFPFRKTYVLWFVFENSGVTFSSQSTGDDKWSSDLPKPFSRKNDLYQKISPVSPIEFPVSIKVP